MAIVKEVKVQRNNQQATYELGDTQTMLVAEPNSNTLWINGEPHDYSTLNPLFSKECAALASKFNLNNCMSSGAMPSPRPVAYTTLDQGFTTEDNALLPLDQAFHCRRYNLDNTQHHGNVLSFTSAQGVKHYLFWYPSGVFSEVSAGYSYYNAWSTRFILIEGDDWANPAAVTTGVLTGITPSGISAQATQTAYIIPVAVDTVNKFIYCHQATVQGSSNNAYSAYYIRAFANQEAMVKLPFTTRLDVGGALTLSSGTGGGIFDITNSYHQADFAANNTHFCGLNDDNTAMFMNQVENDTAGYTSSSGMLAGTYSGYNANKTQFTATRAYSAPKIYWSNLQAGNKTLVASQNTSALSWSSNTAANKPLGQFAMSKFHDSTIVGENKIRYAYNICWSTGGDVGLSYYKWDRATPANSTSNLVTINWNGMTPSTALAHPFPTAEASGSRSWYPHMVCANTFVTKQGNRYFINLLYTFCNSTSISARGAGCKNLVTFEIDTTTWTNATYVGHVSVPAYSMCPLDDNYTKIAIIRNGGLDIHSCNNGVWSITTTEAGSISFVSRDQDNRIWALDQTVDKFSLLSATASQDDATQTRTLIRPKIRLVSDSLPARASVVLQDRGLTYTGNAISSSLKVNAYNTAGARVQTTVYIKLSGSNVVFTANGSTEIEVTTSTAADTTVPITINGSGYIQASASFVL